MKSIGFFKKLTGITLLAILVFNMTIPVVASSETSNSMQATCPPEIGDGASSEDVRQAMCDAYIRNGGLVGVGVVDTSVFNGKVHNWNEYIFDPFQPVDPIDYQIQYFVKDIIVKSMLVYDPSIKKAFLVEGPVFQTYVNLNDPGNAVRSWLGGPIADTKDSTPSSYLGFDSNRQMGLFEKGFIAQSNVQGWSAHTYPPAICDVKLRVTKDGFTTTLHAETKAIRAYGYPQANNSSDPFDVYFVIIYQDGRREWKEMSANSLTSFSLDWENLPLDESVYFYLDAWNHRDDGKYSSYPSSIVTLPDHIDQGDHMWHGSFSPLRTVMLSDGNNPSYPNDNFLCGDASDGFVNYPPVPELGPDNVLFNIGGELGETYTFPVDASASYDPDGGDITKYWFTFGKINESGEYIISENFSRVSFSGNKPKFSDYLSDPTYEELIWPAIKRNINNGEQDAGAWKACVEVWDDENTKSTGQDCQIVTVRYKDTDGDGLSDIYEITHNLNPNNPDSDGDGVVDYLDRDSDGDGLSDGFEKTVFTDPTKPVPYYWENPHIPLPETKSTFGSRTLKSGIPYCNSDVTLNGSPYKTNVGATCFIPGPTIIDREDSKLGNVTVSFVLRNMPRYQSYLGEDNQPTLELHLMPELGSEYDLIPYVAGDMTINSYRGYDSGYNKKITSLNNIGVNNPYVRSTSNNTKKVDSGFGLNLKLFGFEFGSSSSTITFGPVSITIPKYIGGLAQDIQYSQISSGKSAGLQISQTGLAKWNVEKFPVPKVEVESLKSLSYFVPITLGHTGERDFTSILEVNYNLTMTWRNITSNVFQTNKLPYKFYVVITEDLSGNASIQGVFPSFKDAMASFSNSSSVSQRLYNVQSVGSGEGLMLNAKSPASSDLRIKGESLSSNNLATELELSVRSNQELQSGSYVVVFQMADENNHSVNVRPQQLEISSATREFTAIIPTADLRRDGESGQFSIQNILLLEQNGDVIAKLKDTYTTRTYDVTSFAPLAVEIQGSNFNFSPIDSDNDGGYDLLEARIPVSVDMSGEYQVKAVLRGSEKDSNWHSEFVALDSGLRELILTFSADEIREIHKAGTIMLADLRIEQYGQLVDAQDQMFNSVNYSIDQFDLPSVSVIPESFSDHVWDTNNDGKYDFLVVDFDVYVTDPGVYDLTGLLAGSYGDLVRSNWDNYDLQTGINHIQILFDGRAIGKSGAYSPYLIKQVSATNVDTQNVVMISENLYETQEYSGGQFAQGVVVKDVTPPVINLSLSDPIKRVNNQYVFWTVDDLPGPEGVACGVETVTATLNGEPIENGYPIDPFWWDLGTYTVNVTAEDCAGNTASETLTWDMIATLDSLYKTVERLCYWEEIEYKSLDTGICNSLLTKVENAIDHDQKGQQDVTINMLNAFLNEVDAQDGNKITPRAAAILRMDALYLIYGLSSIPETPDTLDTPTPIATTDVPIESSQIANTTEAITPTSTISPTAVPGVEVTDTPVPAQSDSANSIRPGSTTSTSENGENKGVVPQTSINATPLSTSTMFPETLSQIPAVELPESASEFWRGPESDVIQEQNKPVKGTNPASKFVALLGLLAVGFFGAMNLSALKSLIAKLTQLFK